MDFTYHFAYDSQWECCDPNQSSNTIGGGESNQCLDGPGSETTEVAA